MRTEPRTMTAVRQKMAGPGQMNGDGLATYTFIANDGELDRYMDRLNVNGWDLSGYAANPVILYNHDAGDGGPLGLSPKNVLPIGRGRAYVQGKQLLVDVTFDQQDEFAKQVESKVQQGVLNAVSVRYAIPDGCDSPNEFGGTDSTRQILLEISVVTIPGNQRAVRIKGIDAQKEEMNMADTVGGAFDRETIFREAATAVFSKMLGGSGVQVGKRVIDGTGIEFARFIKAKAVAALDPHGKTTAESVLAKWGYSDMSKSLALVRMKAMSSGTYTGGGSLVHPEWADDFVELLRNVTIFRKAGARVLPFGERLEFDGQASSATAAYGSETAEIVATNATTNKPVTLTRKKLRALTVVPNDLLRNASPRAEEFVLNDLRDTVAVTEDLKFLYGLGTLGEPLGLAKQINSANVYAMTALGVAGKPTIREAKNEIDKAMNVLALANAPMRDLFWLTFPTVRRGMLDAGAVATDGGNALELEYALSKTVRGAPFYASNQLNSTDLFLFDASEIVIGQSTLEAEVFPNGTWSVSGVANSGISRDSSPIRIIMGSDIALRHNLSGVNVTGMTWN